MSPPSRPSTPLAPSLPKPMLRDLQRAAQLDPGQWRYGAMLARHYLKQDDPAAALPVAADYSRRFPANDALALLHAKSLLLPAATRRRLNSCPHPHPARRGHDRRAISVSRGFPAAGCRTPAGRRIRRRVAPRQHGAGMAGASRRRQALSRRPGRAARRLVHRPSASWGAKPRLRPAMRSTASWRSPRDREGNPPAIHPCPSPQAIRPHRRSRATAQSLAGARPRHRPGQVGRRDLRRPVRRFACLPPGPRLPHPGPDRPRQRSFRPAADASSVTRRHPRP